MELATLLRGTFPFSDPERWRALVERLADADGCSQSALMRDALRLVESNCGMPERMRLAKLIDADAHLDFAAFLHRILLPANGFEIGRAHPGSATEGFAGTWSKGAAYVPTVRAATPALALLRATFATLANNRRC